MIPPKMNMGLIAKPPNRAIEGADFRVMGFEMVYPVFYFAFLTNHHAQQVACPLQLFCANESFAQTHVQVISGSLQALGGLQHVKLKIIEVHSG